MQHANCFLSLTADISHLHVCDRCHSSLYCVCADSIKLRHHSQSVGLWAANLILVLPVPAQWLVFFLTDEIPDLSF